MIFFKNIIAIFFPKTCIGCLNELFSEETILCSKCIHFLPFMDIKNPEDNKITKKFYGTVPIYKANSLLSYKKGNITQKLIHELKYKSNQKVSSYLGEWFAKELKVNNFFKDVDIIVSVPLHKKRLKKRGYNQVTKFGEALSNVLEIPYEPNVLKRNQTSKTQTSKRKQERFKNIKDKFKLDDVTFFKDKHILLIDDVLTTGATIEACANELLKTKNVKISIATLAYTDLEKN